MRLLNRMAVTVVGTVTALAMMSTSATADTPRLYQNQGTGKCLHHNGTGSVTTTAGCSLTNGALQWHVHNAAETSYDDRRIVSSNGGLCLTAHTDGSVNAQPCEENFVNQLWLFEGLVANGYRVRSLLYLFGYPSCLGSPSNSSGRVNVVDCGSDDTFPFRRWDPLS